MKIQFRISTTCARVGVPIGCEPDVPPDRIFVLRHCLPLVRERRRSSLGATPFEQLLRLERYGGAFAVPATLHLVADLLTFIQIADPRPLDRRDMDEHVLRSIIGLNEPVALLRVEPLHSSGSHGTPFKGGCRRVHPRVGSTDGVMRKRSGALSSYEMPAEPKSQRSISGVSMGIYQSGSAARRRPPFCDACGESAEGQQPPPRRLHLIEPFQCIRVLHPDLRSLLPTRWGEMASDGQCRCGWATRPR
jgi:hypothetical protein